MRKYFCSEENEEEYEKAEKENTTTVFKGETLKNNYEKLFGQESLKKHSTEIYISVSAASGYRYSADKDKYVFFFLKGGGLVNPVEQELLMAAKSKDKLILYVKTTGITYEDDEINERSKITLKLEKETGRYIFESREII